MWLNISEEVRSYLHENTTMESLEWLAQVGTSSITITGEMKKGTEQASTIFIQTGEATAVLHP